jgi:hypothetical protein
VTAANQESLIHRAAQIESLGLHPIEAILGRLILSYMQIPISYHFLALLAFGASPEDREELLAPLIPVMLQRIRTPVIAERECAAESGKNKPLNTLVI